MSEQRREKSKFHDKWPNFAGGLGLVVVVIVLVVAIVNQRSGQSHRAHFHVVVVSLAFAGMGVAISFYSSTRTKSVFLTILTVALGGALLVAGFASTYHSLAANSFSSDLEWGDCVYFALGTLTTAGTGSLAPVTHTARDFVSLQMTVDVVYTVFVFGIVGSRLAVTALKIRP
jgi:hypothetical protein